ncbi:MAG: aromatic hydrocarbon degradation protein [Bacteroidales bacterium]|nr:aromatic hydrocarbon degradation protein [Bacteroidales bacterium]
MKNTIALGLLLVSSVTTAFAGGLLTNTNQSVHFLRNPARDASTEVDAAYTNPAGTTFLEDGFHISLTNQSVIQTRTITSTFAPFAGNGGSATKEFLGKATAPVVPGFQWVYKEGKWALSGGFAITGGGGKATFANGLPSFETGIAMIPLSLTAKGIPTTKYSVDGYMEGQQFIYGAQINGSYKFNDYLSAAVGVRVNVVSSAYKGHLNNIMINPTHPTLNPTGAMMSAPTFFTNAAASAQGASTSLGAIIGAGLGSKTLSELATMNVITASQKAQLMGGIGGQDLTASAAQAAYNQLVAVNTANAAGTQNKSIDYTQSGTGITPIVGLNYNYAGLNIGVKYEFNTKLDVKNKTTKDDTGNYPDGATIPNDIPALFTVGAEYKVMPALKVSGGYHHFFDSDAKMANDKQTKINGGINEILFGVEYDLTEQIMVSAGGQTTNTGATDAYQSDMSYSLSSYSLGFGAAYKITPTLKLNLAYFFTNYDKWTKASTSYNGTPVAGTDEYMRTNKVFGIGLDWSF